ncbi:hypothetical protein D9M71_810690 [compost metagenome]
MDNRVIQVIKGRQDLRGRGEGRGHRPAVEAVVADAHHAGMAGLVVVDQRIGIVETQRIAQPFQVGGVAGEELPARLDPVALGILRELPWGIQFRLQG